VPDLVTFHVLTRKFLEEDKDIPPSEKVRQVMYYSLAIGHHVGVLDCLKKVMECPLSEYETWIEELPEGEARRKMAGLLKFGEIFIDSTYVDMLGGAWSEIKHRLGEPFKGLTGGFLEILAAIAKEPAMYLMIKLPKRMT
jgi:hydrogenase-4 component J